MADRDASGITPGPLDRLLSAADTFEAILAGVPLEAWDGHDDIAAAIRDRLIGDAVELDHTSIAFHDRALARAAAADPALAASWNTP